MHTQASSRLTPPSWNYVPNDFDAGSLAAIEALFTELRQRTIANLAELERWLLDESELQARINAENSRRYVAMTCHTDDETARERFLVFERDISPRVKSLSDDLDKKLLSLPVTAQLPQERYAVFLRARRNQSEIFRNDNTSLQATEAELQTNQQALMGSLAVQFEGKEHTLQQMAPYAESQDRGLRERAYFATLQARRAKWAEQHEIYDRLIRLRSQIAGNAGFASYTPFRFRELQRFDYGPDTCLRFHDAVAKAVVPVVAEMHEERRQRLGLSTLRPYDLEVDLEGRGALRPFQTESELIAIAAKTFARVDQRFADDFDLLVQRGLLDLMSRKGKAPGGYQCTLEDLRLPFIFANGVGLHSDVQTLLHEGGHAFHAIASRDQPLLAYRDSPIEFAETASMSMELMGLEELGQVYGLENARRARKKHLEGILRILPWIASVDAFQHWVYANPEHSQAERCAEWTQIRGRFAPGIDWTGVEDALAHQWTAQVHLFSHAFYYIEYGIAQIAALQIWQRYRRDKSGAVQAYCKGLSLGGSRPLPELFAAAGVQFDLSPTMLQGLVADIREAMATGR